MNATSPLSPRQRIILAIFGTSIGIVAAIILLVVLRSLNAGRTEFESLDDLRSSLMAATPGTPDGDAALRDIIQPHLRNDIIFDLRPNLNLQFQRQPLRTNQCGMRGQPFVPQDKPADTMRIAFLGDSFTMGWGVAEQESFPEVTTHRLTELSRGKRTFQALNYGTPGYSTYQEVARFLQDGIDLDPDIIVVFFVENDFGLPFFVRDLQSPDSLMSLQTFTGLPWSRKEAHFKENRTKLNFADPNGALATLSAEARKRGIPVFVALNPNQRWRSCLRRLPILSKPHRGLKLLPLAPVVSTYIKRQGIERAHLTLQGDPHPSALKHRIMGEVLASFLLEYVPAE